MRLAGKHALVTAAGRGIGLATAKTFAREGAAVAIADIDHARAHDAAAALKGLGARALPVQVDVGDPGSVGAMVGRLSPRLVGLTSCRTTPALAATPHSWRRRWTSGSAFCA